MEDKKLFKKYQSKMIAEGAVKAICCGLILGFAANFITALISWLCGFKAGLWLAVGIGVAGIAVGSVLFYFLRFRPTEKEIAQRIDGLGLEERMITMLELSEDDSYIARRQREDAKLHLADANRKMLKLQVSKILVAVVAVVAACGVGMTTVNALALGGVVPTVPEIVNPEHPEYVLVSYLVEEGGVIEGEAEQILELGADPEPVMAVADEGWVFTGWDDGLEDPYRFDAGITENYSFYALFEKLGGDGDENGDPGEENGGGQQDGDDAQDKPVNGNGDSSDDDANNSGEGGDHGGGETDNNDPSQGEPGGDGEGDGGNAGGRTEPNNQVIDGETYYGSVLEEYYNQVMELLTSDKELTPEEKEFIEKYFASLS